MQGRGSNKRGCNENLHCFFKKAQLKQVLELIEDDEHISRRVWAHCEEESH